MQQQSPLPRKLVAIVGLAALLPPAPLHAAGAPLPEADVRGATISPPGLVVGTGETGPFETDTLRPATLELRASGVSRMAAAGSANEMARTAAPSALRTPADAQWLLVAARPAGMAAPSWLEPSDLRLLAGTELLRTAREHSVSQAAPRASRSGSGNTSVAAMAVAAAMLGMVAVAVGTAVMQAEILTD